jgi:enterochelin esterase-like enzyme
MKRHSMLNLLGMLVLAVWSMALLAAEQAGAEAAPGLSARVQPQVLQSSVLDSQVGYHVYLPEAYEAEPRRRFPVVYWLHGTGGSSQAASGAVSKLFDSAIRAGKVPALILVFPEGRSRSMWVDSKDGRTPMETFVVRELVPHVDASLRTIASSRGRIVEGGSMGGYGAARLGFRYPNTFGAVSMLSAGPLQEKLDVDDAPVTGTAHAQLVLDEAFGGDLAHFRAQSPWALAEGIDPALRGTLVLRQIVGEHDEVLEHNRRFSEHLTALGIPHSYEVLPGVGHSPRELFVALGQSERYWQFFREFLAGLDGT